ncbi:quinone oxidoreductase [Tersicoccus solisilvae]|uniref:Quinone oxidoreductase n=1 Tax=Tersicoccus solisilvae TaxID=1882339 RepID=A0ABQ1PES2_9MICC|nr:quinone oxidoreductase [Tersicoccus solisilvae]GGC95686.1 quinone oxidoreductase [Tersicoccus solisilvae]
MSDQQIPATATAIVAEQAGGPEVLRTATVDVPRPGPGQALVRVAATGVNFIETYQRSGVYDVGFPFTPGAEFAGTVVAVGPGVDGIAEGDRVTTAHGAKGYARYTAVDADALVPVPDGIDDETAAALPLQGMTAHVLVHSTKDVQPGETALVHAGAGGVGLLLIQLLKAAGATVYTTVSTDEKEKLAAAAGADAVLRYDGFADRVRELTDGRGVDVVYDGVGKDTFDDSLASLRARGLMVLFGAASGPVPPFDPQRLNSGGSLYLTRPTMMHYTTTAEDRRSRMADLFALVADGKLDVRIGARYPLADAGRAHADLQARRTTGKVLLVP